MSELETETPADYSQNMLELKRRELDLRDRELGLREREVGGSKWRNPVFVGLIAAALGLLGNLVATSLQNWNTQRVERYKAQSNLILEAIKTGDRDNAAKNLSFFMELGFIDDEQGKIRKFLDRKTDLPVLPSPSVYRSPGGYWENPSAGRWVEHPLAHPEAKLPFEELRRDSDYIYLFDRTRTKDSNSADNFLLLRLPIKGGTAQWSWSNPISWVDLTPVTPDH